MAPIRMNTWWVCLIIGLWWHVVTTGAAQNEYDYVVIGGYLFNYGRTPTPAHSLTRSIDRSIALSPFRQVPGSLGLPLPPP